MKRKPTERDWSDVETTADDPCRWCGVEGRTERAHIAGRTYDRKGDNGIRKVNPDSIVGLCREHHRQFDARQLDLLPALTLEEQVQAVIELGGIEAARMRLVPSEYSKLPDRRADQVEQLVEAVRDLPSAPAGVRLTDQRRAEIAAALEPFGGSTYRPPHFAPQETAA